MNNNNNSFLSNIPPVVLNLMIINLLFWFASQVFPSTFGIDLVKILGLHYWFSDQFNPIQLVTYMFMHDTNSMSHLLCNMFGVWMFGRTLEQVWGAKKFLFFYFVFKVIKSYVSINFLSHNPRGIVKHCIVYIFNFFNWKFSCVEN